MIFESIIYMIPDYNISYKQIITTKKLYRKRHKFINKRGLGYISDSNTRQI